MNKKKIGQEIKEKRIQMNMTQNELSKHVNLSRSYISDIENGRYMCSVSTLIKISKILDIDLIFLSSLT